MALPAAPNALSYSQINTELGRASGTSFSLSDPYVKTLFSDWSNPISMSNGRGKAWPLIHPSVDNVNLFYSGTGEGNITVPAGAFRVSMKVWGAGGGAGGRGSGSGSLSGGGGSGAFLWGIYDVSPGETLSYSVGRGGNGGGSSGLTPYAAEGGGGGGATWLRNMSRVDQPYYFIVGGGGGGAGTGSGTNDHGGAGGGAGLVGITGYNNNNAGSSGPGQPGGSTAGGAGGIGISSGGVIGIGGAGSFLTGGYAADGGSSSIGYGGRTGGGQGGNNQIEGGGGGGGGSGWFGGGGGGWTTNQGGGGGGGGSTYYQGWLLHLIHYYNGQTPALGSTSLTQPAYDDANRPTGVGTGAPASTTSGQDGAAGTTGAISLQFFTT